MNGAGRGERAGYVLVGGKSSRMRRDKALLPWAGGLLAQFVARAVEIAAGSVVLVGSPNRYGHLGFPITPDLYPGEGPLGGILTVLQVSRAEFNLVTACDMPALSAGFLKLLLDAAAECDADILAPAGPGGRLEPLCAVYRSRARATLYEAFASGVRKVTAAFQGLRVTTLPVTDAEPFQNINTPEDWDSLSIR